MKTFCIQKKQFEITENQISQNSFLTIWNVAFFKHIGFPILLLLFSFSILPAQTPTAPTLGTGGPTNPLQISTINHLLWIADNSSRWGVYYIQTANIDATNTYFPGGWSPIGNSTTKFTGIYEGNGYTISNLNCSIGSDNIGLFGYTYGATISNLRVEGTITGSRYVGGLIGYAISTTVTKCSYTGTINAGTEAGLLIGVATYSSISECYSSGTATAVNSVGGFIYYSGNSTISNNYNRGSVQRTSGYTYTDFASFICSLGSSVTISNCYTTGAVVYLSGTNPTTKGFISSQTGSNTFSNNYFDSQTTGQTTGIGATAKTTSEMTYQPTFSGWDFMSETTNGSNNYWGMNPASNNSYPFLSWQGYTHIAPLIVTTNSATSVLATTASIQGEITSLGSPNPTQHGHCWSTSANPTTANSLTTLGTKTSAGTFSSAITGLAPSTTYYVRAYATNTYRTVYSSEVSFTTSAVQNQTITFGALADKTYGGGTFSLTATASSGLTVTYTSSNLNVATLSGSTVTIKGAGTSTITANQAGNDNYHAAPPVNQTLTVLQKSLTVSGAVANNKTYDGDADATISGATLVGKVGKDDVSITDPRTGSFNNKNVGRNKPVTTVWTLSGTKAANYTLTQPTGLLADVIAKTLTVTGAVVTTKEYDGDIDASISGAALSGVIKGETVTLGNHRDGTFNSKNVGTGKTVTTAMTISGTDASNYTLTQPTLTGNITAKGLTVTGAVAQNKVYNGSSTATITGATLSGTISGDVVSLDNATSGNFDNANVGNGKPVTTAMTLSGTDAGNYTLTQPSGLTANITPKGLTVTGADASNKVYDGNTDATITGATLSGAVKGDDVTLDNSTTGEFDSANIGSRKPVSTNMTLSGADAGNYTLTQPSGLQANITAKNLTVSGAIAQEKVYDAGTSATISGSTLVGVVSGDDCTLSGGTRGTFSQANVGTDIPVTTSMTLRGDQAGNYTLTQPTGLMANILQKDLIVTADNIRKTLGTTYTFTGTEFTTTGLAGSDAVTSVTLTSNGSGAGANIGDYIITISNAIGSGLSNYSIDYIDGTMTVEDRTELTLTGLTANDKTYDGTTTATISSFGILTGVDPAHTVSLVTTGATASFADKIHDQDKIVTVTGLSLEGPDAYLYFIGNQTTTATLHKRQLILNNFSVDDKIYDGTRNTSGGRFDDDRISGDDLTISFGAVFDTKAAGNGKTVDFSWITIEDGGDKINYYLTGTTAQTTANIFKKELDVEGATANDKVYDGAPGATISGATLTGAIAGDDVVLGDHTAGNFDTKNIGENKPVTTAMTLGGTDSGNYTLNQPAGLNAYITSKELTVAGTTALDKVYNGTTSATLNGATLNGAIGGDNVALSNYTSGTFAQSTPGTNIPVNSAMTLTGTDAGNYTLTQPSGLQADISQKPLTVTGADAQDKVYDGNTHATITGATLSGIVKSEDVTLQNQTAGTFQRATAGRDITVNTAMTLSGTDAGNYSLTQPILDADITKKEITVTGAAAGNKTYDGTTAAEIKNATPIGAIGGDIVQLANHTSGTFVSKNVGEDIAVSTAMTLTGADAGNYSLTQPTGLSATISQKELTVTGAAAQNKVYDRTPNATLSGATLSGKIESDDVNLTGHTTGTFTQVTVGNNIPVTVTMNISGTDAPNYIFTQPTGFTAHITLKALSITANNILKNEGETYTFQGNEFSTSGLVAGDAVSSATLASEGAAAQAEPGEYPITIVDALGTGVENYDISYINGTMTVNSEIPNDFELPDTNLGLGQNECFNALNNLTVAGNGKTVVLQNGSSATFIAGHSIRFLPGFHAQAGTYVDAHISTTDFCENKGVQGMLAVQAQPDTEDKSLNLGISHTIKTNEICPKLVKTYPNPCQGRLVVELENYSGETELFITNLLGEIVYRTSLTEANHSEHNLSHLRAGLYLTHVVNGNDKITRKLIIK